MKKVCPYWVGYLLIMPLRKLIQNPNKILSPYIQSGMTVLDIGPGMGYFTLPMAEMVGSSGKVICVDLQEKMITKLRKRAESHGVLDKLETRICTPTSLGIDDLQGKIDFALVFAVAHEVPDVNVFFKEIYQSLKPGGKMLFTEPRGHISEKSFQTERQLAEKYGFQIIDQPEIRRSFSVLYQKDS